MVQLGQCVKEGPVIYEYPYTEDKVISFYDLIANTMTVVKVFKRLDCPLTKYEAQELSLFYDRFQEIGIKLIGISFDVAGSEDFVNSGYWKGEFYLDPKRSIYRHLGLFKRTPLLSKSSLLRREAKFITESNQKQQNLMQIGGTFVLRNSKLIYKYEQLTPLCLPDSNAIFQFCQYLKATVYSEDQTNNSSDSNLLSSIFSASKQSNYNPKLTSIKYQPTLTNKPFINHLDLDPYHPVPKFEMSYLKTSSQ